MKRPRFIVVANQVTRLPQTQENTRKKAIDRACGMNDSLSYLLLLVSLNTFGLLKISDPHCLLCMFK
jgi:hypothetical protein